ncbi:hypothetical protein [uncultured Draconibacterium sp.]|uniref:hypothetical protein n=1 Tax=uncultured Draconibacterium sp. TaxID=1573823 RepID=UPI0029C71901|nr:hypothetical protein [uncultured Draconibacterium sp.]
MNILLDNNQLGNKAAELFWMDYNCAQSVLLAYSDVLQVDRERPLIYRVDLAAAWAGYRKPVAQYQQPI